MAPLLYPYSWLITLLALILWFYFQSKTSAQRWIKAILILGVIGYIAAVLFAKGAFPFKIGIMFRDLIAIAVIAFIFSLFRKQKKLFWILVLALMAAYPYVQKKVFMQTFPQQSKIILDESGELLIEVLDGHNISELDAVMKKHGLTYETAFSMQRTDFTDLDDYYLVNIPGNGKLKKIKKALLKTGLVEWVEDNEIVQVNPIEVEREERTGRNYGINDPGLAYLWGFEQMDVDRLYNFLIADQIAPARKALIAILDTGIDSRHEDIQANFTSIQTKYDNDPRGHGTHCAGIAAAVSNNGLGIASLSPDNSFVEVTSIKVLSSMGSGTQKGIINGILEAADQNADVISLSLGGRSNQSKQRAYQKAVEYANGAGAIVIVAAGNEGRSAKDIAPANTPGVIAVSAVDENLKKASFSNRINEVDMGIAAPGVNIYSTIPGNKYAVFNGTSMATPYVSGLVGVLKSINPSLTTTEVYEILNSTGKETKNVQETGRFIQPDLAIREVLK
ncbi:MAG: S8 family serine peptidase [Bacteroidetes bacterium]|nr:S8 family serine peptidase [Bacteroidota bacterium]